MKTNLFLVEIVNKATEVSGTCLRCKYQRNVTHLVLRVQNIIITQMSRHYHSSIKLYFYKELYFSDDNVPAFNEICLYEKVKINYVQYMQDFSVQTSVCNASIYRHKIVWALPEFFRQEGVR